MRGVYNDKRVLIPGRFMVHSAQKGRANSPFVPCARSETELA